jgi:hypothetical protein
MHAEGANDARRFPAIAQFAPFHRTVGPTRSLANSERPSSLHRPRWNVAEPTIADRCRKTRTERSSLAILRLTIAEVSPQWGTVYTGPPCSRPIGFRRTHLISLLKQQDQCHGPEYSMGTVGIATARIWSVSGI